MLHRTCVVLCLALAPNLAHAAELDVGPGQLYTTIQGAIDAAGDGDTIWVHAGSYPEALFLSSVNDLTIESVGGAGTVVVGAPGVTGSDTIEFFGASATLRGMTVTGNAQRRSVLVANDSTATLDTMELLNGVGSDFYGGGNLAVYGASHATVLNSSLIDGSADVLGVIQPFGGNARVEWQCSLTLVDTVVSGGRAERGGGLYADDSATLVVVGGQIAENHALGTGDNDGGGLYGDHSSVVSVEDALFSGNEAGTDVFSAGAAAFVFSDSADFDGCTFLNNSFTFEGGAIAAEVGYLTVLGSVFIGNRASLGGAFSCIDTLGCKVSDSWFEGNTAESGGAGRTFGADALMVRNSFCKNTATGVFGGTGEGGALFLDGQSVSLSNNQFFENSAANNGGAIRSQDGSVFSTNNNYVGNSSVFFGGAVSTDLGLGFATQFTTVNDLVAHNVSLVSGAFFTGITVVPNTSWGLYWLNNPNAGFALFDSTSVLGIDPQINGYVPGDCDPFLQRPRMGSPLLFGGNPFLLNDDGSGSHIGAFGGPQAETDLNVDNDGDGVVALFDCNDDSVAIGAPTGFYIDSDGDGIGGDERVLACEMPEGTVSVGADCDDSDASVGAPPVWWPDDDTDGYGAPFVPVQACFQPGGTADNADDCDDSDANVHPGLAWYRDSDSDGYGDANGVFPVMYGCYQPFGHVANQADCDDSSASVNPDNIWYVDSDEDGVGTGIEGFEACNPGPGFSPNNVDCDDSDDTVAGPTGWFYDGDGDGFGTENAAVFVSCERPLDYTDNSSDCDDFDATVYPDAPEYCDEIDHSCDGDPRLPAPIDQDSYYLDADGDGAGDPATVVLSCDPRDDLVDDAKDCDDTDPQAFPGNTETYYNGVDNDCDGSSDFDQDGDGFDASEFSGEGGDCNDLDDAINPDAEDLLDDNIDANCDGIDARTWMVGGGGCGGCNQSSGGSGGWLVMAAGLIAIRRRKSTRNR